MADIATELVAVERMFHVNKDKLLTIATEPSTRSSTAVSSVIEYGYALSA